MYCFKKMCNFIQMRWTVAWSRPTGRHGPPRPAVSSRMLGEKEKRWRTRGRAATCAGRGLNCPSAPTWSVALLPLKVRKLVSSLLWHSEVACFLLFFLKYPVGLCRTKLNPTWNNNAAWFCTRSFDSSLWRNHWVDTAKPDHTRRSHKTNLPGFLVSAEVNNKWSIIGRRLIKDFYFNLGGFSGLYCTGLAAKETYIPAPCIGDGLTWFCSASQICAQWWPLSPWRDQSLDTKHFHWLIGYSLWLYSLSVWF